MSRLTIGKYIDILYCHFLTINYATKLLNNIHYLKISKNFVHNNNAQEIILFKNYEICHFSKYSNNV